MKSEIYKDLSREVAVECGYFEPKVPHSGVSGKHASKLSPELYDRIVYFPGSFGAFHEGHVSVLRRAIDKYPNSLIVVAPSNSDYAAEKYGAWSEFASNKYRYENIKRVLAEANIEAVIDTGPMLDHVCDHNFTDQLFDFVAPETAAAMKYPPVILCGKDRSDFMKLNEHTDRVVVDWFDDITGQSTSAIENPQRLKKHLILRCNTFEEFELFREYFDEQYFTIHPFFLKDELVAAKDAAKWCKATHTNCKEYKDFLPYISISRTFENPLEDGKVTSGDVPEGAILLDSDIFSGTTRRYVESKGAKLYGLIHIEDLRVGWELLDISDFLKDEWQYPHTDISSRCSMQAFDVAFHNHFQEFKDKLRHVNS